MSEKARKPPEHFNPELKVSFKPNAALLGPYRYDNSLHTESGT